MPKKVVTRMRSPVLAALVVAALAGLAPAVASADRAGQPVVVKRGDAQTSEELNAAALGHLPPREHPEEHDKQPPPKSPDPASPLAADGAAALRRASIRSADISSTTNFDGPTLSDSHSYPPDTMGDVGPTQYIVMINGRVRSYSKATGAPDGVLNTDTDVFWRSAMTPVGGAVTSNFTSDPHIRYDRLSQRWIADMIDVPYATSPGDMTNRIMVAVSDSATISASTSWHFFSFSAPAGEFADYPTLGVDANAIYIGTNEFGLGANGAFLNTNAYVVQKSSVLGAGSIQVSAFRNLLTSSTGAGPYTPQGVDNPAPSATTGYFVGVDNAQFGRLDIRTVSTPGSPTPSLSGNVAVTVPVTAYPKNVPNSGGVALDALDDRLFAAQIRDGRLWTAHNIAVNSCGNAASTASPCNHAPDRTGARWYEVSLTGTPTLTQSGTVFDSASSAPRSYWIPSVAVNGQGAMAMGGSTSSATAHPDAWYAGRNAGDATGALTAPTRYTSASATYSVGNNRWGDYSMTSVDPTDDQTMWTIQEYVASQNVWGTHIAKLSAPAPAAPTSASPATVRGGQPSLSVELTGPANAGWFDPGAGFSKRLAVTVGCGVTVNSVTYNGPADLSVDLNTSHATRGTCDVTVTNPDGQQATAAGLLATNNAPVANPDFYSATKDTALSGTSVLANDSDADGDALTAVLVSGPAHGTLSLAADGTFTYTPTTGYSGADSFTYRAGDGLAQSDVTTASINVIDPATNQPPVTSGDTYAVPHAGVLIASSVLGNDSDPDGNTLVATKLTEPAHGTLTFASDGTFTYVADSTSTGPDSFTYAAGDGLTSSAPTTVTLTGPADQAPVGQPDAYPVSSSGTLDGTSVLGNDSDADGDALTAVLMAGPANGTLTLNPDGTFHYQAAAAFAGVDTFSYQATDGRLASAATTVALTVAPRSGGASTGSGGGGGGAAPGTGPPPPRAAAPPPPPASAP